MNKSHYGIVLSKEIAIENEEEKKRGGQKIKEKKFIS